MALTWVRSFPLGLRARLDFSPRAQSSAAFSPIENCYIGLAFLKRGPERWGEKIKAVNFIADTELNCEIGPPVFYDPDGGKTRA